ncbi:MAG: PAS domain S-box protein [Proteobacteria bacterium]|nr:PAS domain S-box protein [Pseudomonadota bacterium]
MSEPEAKSKHLWLIRTYYRVRALAFAALFVAIGLHMAGRDYGGVAWVLLMLQFLVYPHLIYWRALKSSDPLKAELSSLVLDSLLVGIWSAALEFPIWIAFTLFIGPALNNAINRGWRGALYSLLAFSSGALAWILVAEFRYSPDTNAQVTTICLTGLSVYILGLGNIVHTQNRKLRETREALRKSEEDYRLITENAGDLIAMLDAEGRWVYTSPSYRRLLPEEALGVGVSALLHVHREDRDMVRAQLNKSVETGESQEFLYRLMAGDGGANEFQATVNSFTQADERKLVIVSIDITELRQRDKALAIQAHAFENMAEGMMITAADGMILSVNRAFTAVTGYSKEDVVGKSESEFRIALQPPKFYEDIRDALAKHGYWTGITWSRRKDNEIYRERHSVSSIRDEAGHTTHYITFFAIAGDDKNGVK